MTIIEEYKKRFKNNSTSYLIRKYNHLNSEYRKYAREEFKKRKVPARELPYKTRSKRRSTGFGFNMGKW